MIGPGNSSQTEELHLGARLSYHARSALSQPAVTAASQPVTARAPSPQTGSCALEGPCPSEIRSCSVEGSVGVAALLAPGSFPPYNVLDLQLSSQSPVSESRDYMAACRADGMGVPSSISGGGVLGGFARAVHKAVTRVRDTQHSVVGAYLELGIIAPDAHTCCIAPSTAEPPTAPHSHGPALEDCAHSTGNTATGSSSGVSVRNTDTGEPIPAVNQAPVGDAVPQAAHPTRAANINLRVLLGCYPEAGWEQQGQTLAALMHACARPHACIS